MCIDIFSPCRSVDAERGEDKGDGQGAGECREQLTGGHLWLEEANLLFEYFLLYFYTNNSTDLTISSKCRDADYSIVTMEI